MTEKSPTIVFIDDDDIAHYLLKSLIKLQRPDLSLTSFLSPFEALELMDDKAFEASVLFLDINMPKMNGWEFLEELERRNYAMPPVYMLTSSEDAKDINRVGEFKSVLGYFTKPMTPVQLATVLEKHLPA